jgi:class 3 adenylate cyclase/CHASE2 domain-containing sensor protein
MAGWRLRDALAVMVIVLAAGAAGVLAPRLIGVFAVAEQWLIDVRVALLSPAEPQHPEIVLVTVTEETLAILPYRSPVDREFLASLVQALDAAGARAIGIDILFDRATEPEKDAALRRALAETRAPVIVAWADVADGLSLGQSRFVNDYLAGLVPGAVTLVTEPYLDVVRWIYPGRRTVTGEYITGFPGALAAAVGVPPPGERVLLAFRPPPDVETPPFRSFPAHHVSLLPASWFEGKIVLIGSDLPQTDRHRTPMATVFADGQGTLPGVNIHAHALAQLLDARAAPTIPRAAEFGTVAVISSIAIAVSALNISIALLTLLGTLLFAALWLAGFVIYARTGLLIPLIAPSLAYVLTFAAGNGWWRGRAQRESTFIREAFSRFTSPAVVQALVRDPARLRLGGEKRVISCLFTDVAGFTHWLEQSAPEAALATLNNYLDGMCRICFEHDGTLNKIVGDALLVLFGAPIEQPDHALRAVRCALAMDAFARAFVRDDHAAGGCFGLTRIGVHTGAAVVGNFGGDRFFDYTAYGDTVNIAARLETANKHLGTLVSVSAATVAGCAGAVNFRPIGSLIVVGRSEPVDVFEPLAPTAPAAGYLQNYLDAFAAMRKHEWQRAQAALDDLRQRYPDDGLVGFHARRLAAGELGVVLRLAGK